MYPHTGGPAKSFTDFYSNFQAMKKVGYLFLILRNKDDVSPRGRQISVRCDKPYGIGKFWRPYYLNLPFWLDAPQSHRPIVEHQVDSVYQLLWITETLLSRGCFVKD